MSSISSDLERRIAQFENMAKADPENEMAHFSLAGAYVQAGRHAEAAESYLRCTELAPSMSKAYQLAGEAMVRIGDKDRAAQVLTRGYTIASERGDLMPKNAMAEVLRGLGRPVPAAASGSGLAGGGKGDVSLLGSRREEPGAAIDPASKPGEPGGGTKMERPPFKGPLGEWIQQNISRERFDLWIAQGTKVINELRLNLSREQDEAVYDEHMREFLGIDDALLQRIMSGR